MELRKIICKCGHDLGNKRIDLSVEYKVNGTCPHCHKQYTIVHGNGRAELYLRE